MMPTVMLVDDHAVVREGLASLLAIAGGFGRVWQAADGNQAIELARHQQPDLIVIDLLMPGMQGPEAIALLKQICPDSRIAVLSSSDDQQLALSALKAGAQSFLVKSMSGEEILSALKQVAAGTDVIHPAISASILKLTLTQQGAQETPFAALTPREIGVLTELARGASNARIAVALHITERTVKSHIGNILSKLHLTDRTEAVAFAWRHGLIKD